MFVILIYALPINHLVVKPMTFSNSLKMTLLNSPIDLSTTGDKPRPPLVTVATCNIISKQVWPP